MDQIKAILSTNPSDADFATAIKAAGFVIPKTCKDVFVISAHKSRRTEDAAINGVICKLAGEWRILVTPMPAVANMFRTMNVLANIAEYECSPAENGSVYNLYYNDKWCVGSTHAHDMSDYQIEGRTYRQRLDLEIDFDKLDKTLVHTVCVCTAGAQPRLKHSSPPDRIVHIRSATPDGAARDYSIARIVTDGESQTYMPVQPRMRLTKEDYFNIATQSKDALSAFIRGAPPVYGWILRRVGSDASTPESNIMIESSLMKYIRQTWYNIPTHVNQAVWQYDADKRRTAIDAFVALRVIIQGVGRFECIFDYPLGSFKKFLREFVPGDATKLQADLSLDVSKLDDYWRAWCAANLTTQKTE